MTHIHKLTEHTEQVEKYIESLETPEEYAVLIGGFTDEYDVTAPEADREAFEEPEQATLGGDPTEAEGNGVFEIGSLGFAGDAFGHDPVGEYSLGDSMRTAFLGTLVVHRSALSDEVIEELWGEQIAVE